MSPQAVPSYFIANAAQEHNKLLADHYLRQRNQTNNGENSVAASNHFDFSTPETHPIIALLDKHTKGGDVTGSPWVSTTIKQAIGHNWATKFHMLHEHHQGKQIHGVKFTSHPPFSGSLATFGRGESRLTADVSAFPMFKGSKLEFEYPDEHELLIPGALDPSSITKIEVFDNKNYIPSTPFITAQVNTESDRIRISLTDLRSQSKRVYEYDPSVNEFILMNTLPLSESQATTIKKELHEHEKDYAEKLKAVEHSQDAVDDIW